MLPWGRGGRCAIQRYGQQRLYTLEIQQDAAELQLRAERKAGTMLAEMGLHGGSRKSSSQPENLKLSDLGIGHNDSHRWQLEAELSDANRMRRNSSCGQSGGQDSC